MINTRFKFKKAAILAAFFVFIPTSFAQKTETYKDIIEKAYNLSLQKDRPQATAILVNTLNRETKKGLAQKELLLAIQKVTSVFYSDKAQQTYEIGISLVISDLASAQTKLNEAAQQEAGNLLIDTGLARAYLSAANCGSATKALDRQIELFDIEPDLQLLRAQLLICASKIEDFRSYKTKVRTAKVLKKELYDVLWDLLEVESQYKSSLFPEANTKLNELKVSWPNYPEVYYWNYKIDSEQKGKPIAAARKYLALCKGLSQRQQRDYLQDPWLCRRTLEVENFLKKNNNSEI